jgi:hypothetical protein
MLEGAFHLLCGGDVEDVLQLVVHLVHPVDGVCGQSVQERDHCGHVLAGPDDGGIQRPLAADGGGEVPSLISGIGEVNHYGPLYLERGLAVV